MAEGDRPISELTPASTIQAPDRFVLEQDGTAKSLTGLVLLQRLAAELDGHGGISSIVKTGTNGLVDTYTITFADQTATTFPVTNGNGIDSITQYYAVSNRDDQAPATWETSLQTMTVTERYLWSYSHIVFTNETSFDTPAQVIGVYGDTGDPWYMHIKYASQQPTSNSDMGDFPDEWVGVYSGTSPSAPSSYTSYTWYKWKGPQGDTGVSVVSVTYSGSDGLVDTYTVTFSNGTATTFTVTNGSSIANIARTGQQGLTYIYTVTLTDGSTSTFNVVNGKSIVSVAWTSNSGGSVQGTAGTYDTYTITYNDNDTSTFVVYNGANGAGAVSSVDGVVAVGDDVPLLTIGNGAPTTTTAGNVKSRYFDALNSVLYICTAYDSSTGTYTWKGTGVTVDSALSSSSTNPVQNSVITAKVGTSALNTTAQNLSGAINEVLSDIPSASDSAPANLGTAASAGSSADYSRKDHVHKTPVESTTITLSAANWSNGANTISNAFFVATGYSYIVSPAGSSFEAYTGAMIYADDVTMNGQIVFHCLGDAPSSNLTVNVVRMVSA